MAILTLTKTTGARTRTVTHAITTSWRSRRGSCDWKQTSFRETIASPMKIETFWLEFIRLHSM
jgi:hypothetical protein